MAARVEHRRLGLICQPMVALEELELELVVLGRQGQMAAPQTG